MSVITEHGDHFALSGVFRVTVRANVCFTDAIFRIQPEVSQVRYKQILWIMHFKKKMSSLLNYELFVVGEQVFLLVKQVNFPSQAYKFGLKRLQIVMIHVT